MYIITNVSQKEYEGIQLRRWTNIVKHDNSWYHCATVGTVISLVETRNTFPLSSTEHPRIFMCSSGDQKRYKYTQCQQVGNSGGMSSCGEYCIK